MKNFGSLIAAGLGDLSLALTVAGLAMGYGRAMPAAIAFLITAIGMLLGVVATVAGLIILARNGMSLRGGMAMLGLVPALCLIYGVVSSRGAPMINDITTDRVYPPTFTKAQTLPENAGRDMSYPEAFKAQVEKGYPDLQSLGMKAARDDVFVKALNLAKSQPGWTVTSSTVTDKESLIEGIAVSRIFGFADDFVVRITDSGDGVVVDMRSKSRDGKGDMGANAARIRDFLTKIRA